MQFHIFLLLLLLMIKQVFSLRVEEECEARSVWGVPYTWNEYYLSFWTPPTSEDSREILTIEIEFENHIFPVTYDAIQVHHNETVFVRVREGIRDKQRYSIAFAYTEGWTGFIFTLDEHFGIVYDDVTVFNASVEYIPKFLRFEGSNITVDCHSDVRFWKTSKNPTTVPLTKSDQHWLSFYSSKELLPAINIEMRQFPLGWDEGRLTTIPTKAKSLPPYVDHHLRLNCFRDTGAVCTVMIGDNGSIAEKLRLGDLPKTVTISGGRNGENFYYVFLHDINLLPHLLALEDSESENCYENCKAKTVALIVLSVLMFTSIIFATLIITYRKLSRTCLRMNESSNKIKADKERCKDLQRTEIPEDEILFSGPSSDSGIGEGDLPLSTHKSQIQENDLRGALQSALGTS